jgi:hypothetical protein
MASAEMLDFSHSLLQYMVEVARSHSFGGLSGACDGLPGQSVIAALLRWQNDQGQTMRKELDVVAVDGHLADRRIATVRNPKGFSEWLLQPAADQTEPGSDVDH